MTSLSVKILKDEDGNNFVPYTSTIALYDPDGETISDKIAKKLEASSLIAGTGITLIPDITNHTVEIQSSVPGANLINNLTTSVTGQGALDAYQGYVLNTTKVNISDIVDNCTSLDNNKPLSAYQGYILFNKFNNYTPSASLATVATSGNYNDLTNKPTIPTKTSDLTNDNGFIDAYALEKAMKENVVYSTEEKRIGTWIDGKPLYRKTCVETLSSKLEDNGSGTQYFISPTISNVDEIVSITGTIDNYQLPYIYKDTNTAIDYYNKDNNIIVLNIYKTYWTAGMKIKLTMEYTKTTDQRKENKRWK